MNQCLATPLHVMGPRTGDETHPGSVFKTNILDFDPFIKHLLFILQDIALISR